MAETPRVGFIIDQMDMLRSALFNALASGLTLEDVCRASEHAADIEDMDDAISILGIGAIDTDPLRSVMNKK